MMWRSGLQGLYLSAHISICHLFYSSVQFLSTHLSSAYLTWSFICVYMYLSSIYLSYIIYLSIIVFLPASYLSSIYQQVLLTIHFSNSGLLSIYLPIYLSSIYSSLTYLPFITPLSFQSPIRHISAIFPPAHPIFHSSIICHLASYQLVLISHLSVYLFICPSILY